MQLRSTEWMRLDPQTGELVDEYVEQPQPSVPERRRLSRAPRSPWTYPDGTKSHGAARRPKRYALSARQMTALFAKAMSPPEGVPRGELRSHAIKPPLAKTDIAEYQRRSVNHTRLRWNLAGTCLTPRLVTWLSGTGRTREGEGRLPGRLPQIEPNAIDRQAELTVRCRRCEDCLDTRAKKWAARARRELDAASRTWLVTLTLNDASLNEMRYRAIANFNTRGKAPRTEIVRGSRLVKYYLDPPASFEELPDDEQYLLVEKEMFVELGLYLKRLHEQCERRAAFTFRHFAVSERKSSGQRGDFHLHYHVLFHETVPLGTEEGRLRSQMIEDQWKYRRIENADWEPLGFVKPRLFKTTGSPYYLTKYLGKELAARVRCSKHYGRQDEEMRRADREALANLDDAKFAPSPCERSTTIKEASEMFIDPDDVAGSAQRKAASVLRKAGVDAAEVVTVVYRERDHALEYADELRSKETADQTRSRWLADGGVASTSTAYKRQRDGDGRQQDFRRTRRKRPP